MCGCVPGLDKGHAIVVINTAAVIVGVFGQCASLVVRGVFQPLLGDHPAAKQRLLEDVQPALLGIQRALAHARTAKEEFAGPLRIASSRV